MFHSAPIQLGFGEWDQDQTSEEDEDEKETEEDYIGALSQLRLLSALSMLSFDGNDSNTRDDINSICTKCEGKGIIHKESACNYCLRGRRHVECRKCDQTGSCSRCQGTGAWTKKSECKSCGGKGRYPPINQHACNRCNGSGVQRNHLESDHKCIHCHGSGRWPADSEQQVDCRSCHGTGTFERSGDCGSCKCNPGKCTVCKGQGAIEQECGGCEGTGIWVRDHKCNHCQGSGFSKRQESIKNQNAIKRTADQIPSGADLSPNMTCSICVDQEKNAAFIPCGHTFCMRCAGKMKTCPFCKEKASFVLRIYL